MIKHSKTLQVFSKPPKTAYPAQNGWCYLIQCLISQDRDTRAYGLGLALESVGQWRLGGRSREVMGFFFLPLLRCSFASVAHSLRLVLGACWDLFSPLRGHYLQLLHLSLFDDHAAVTFAFHGVFR